MKKSIFLFMFLLIFSFSLVTMAAEYGGTLTVGLDSDITTLDPHLSTARVDRQVLMNLYDTLFTVDKNMKISPGLVKEWTVEDGGQSFTFKLRDDVYFHDGTRFNAEAVKYNFERMLDPDVASPRKSDLGLVTDIEVAGEYELKVQLSKPFIPFLATLSDRAGMMVSPAAVKKEGDDFANNPVGSGPFMFTERVVQDRVVLSRNEKYWEEGKPYLDKVVYKPYSDGNTRVINLTSGSLDIADEIPPKDVKKLEQTPGVTMSMGNGLGFQGLWINKEKAPFNNNDLAKALEKAINRQALVNVIFGETAVPADSPFPPGTVMHDDSRQTPAVDPEGAKELLKKAGKPDGFTFTLMTSTAPTSKQVAQLVQSMAAQVGIKIKIELLEFGTLLERLESGNYQAQVLGWSGRVDADGNTYSFFHKDGGMNDSNYYDDEVSAILDKTRAEADVEKRKALFSQLMTYLDRDLPYIFIYHPKNLKAYKNRVQGFEDYPDSLMRLESVWLK